MDFNKVNQHIIDEKHFIVTGFVDEAKMKIVNKLVRDNIPNIILEKNEKPCYYILNNNDDYYNELCKKLIEETTEFLESGEIEELADICEVLSAILIFKNIDFSELKNIMDIKTSKKGNFAGRVFLLGIE